jgi:repressor LexA
MIPGLERDGFIRRQPGLPRSIQVLVPHHELPIFDWLSRKPS